MGDGYDNGYRIECECGWVSVPCRKAKGAGGEYDDHLKAMEEARA